MKPAKRSTVYEAFASNDATLSRKDLLALGVTNREIDWALAHGDVVSKRRAVLEPPGVPDSPRREQLRVLCALGPDGCFSHLGAAGAARLPGVTPGALVVTVRRPRAARLSGVVAHAAPALSDLDVTVIDGLRCTTVARTILDLSPVVDRKTLRLMIRAAEIRDRHRAFDAIEAAAGRTSKHRRPQVQPALDIVSALRAETGDELPISTRCVEAFRRHGLVDFSLELPVTWGGRDFFCDAGWRPEMVDAEFDDDHTHSTVIGTHDDKDRDSLARREGWIVERAHPLTDPDEFALLIKHHLAQRRRATA